jgi:hypothetical protein
LLMQQAGRVGAAPIPHLFIERVSAVAPVELVGWPTLECLGLSCRAVSLSGTREPPRKAAVRGRRQIVLTVVSLGTALWLAAELFVMVTGRSTTWPFSALTMFKEPRSHAAVVSLNGVTRSGERQTVGHEDFGLEVGNSLHVFLTRRIVRMGGRRVGARPGARQSGRQLIRLYNERHDGDPLRRLDVDVRLTAVPLDSRSSETTTRIVSVRP